MNKFQLLNKIENIIDELYSIQYHWSKLNSEIDLTEKYPFNKDLKEKITEIELWRDYIGEQIYNK